VRNSLNFILKIYSQGINPQSLRGSETGVYIGFTTIGMPGMLLVSIGLKI